MQGLKRLLRPIFVAILSLFTSFGFAAPIPVTNAGFEADPIGTGVPSGWTLFDPFSVTPSYAIGIFDPGAIAPGSDFYNGLPPEGANVAWTFLDYNFMNGPFGIEQTLAATLMPNSRYDLSVEIGNPQSATSPRSGVFFDYSGITAYAIQLLAGGTVIAEDINSLGNSIGEGEFETASLVFETGDTDTLLGQALGIRLVNMNNIDMSNLDSWASEVDFDDVRLSVSAIPVPAAVWLFGTALTGLAGLARHKKNYRTRERI